MKKFLAIVMSLAMVLSLCAGAFAATEADLSTEPEFDPNPDYDKWTVVEFTIEAIQADLVCTISAKEDNSEFYLETNFYGDDQMTRTTYDGTNYEVLEDKTGFMAGDTPAILDIAIEQDLWVPMNGAEEAPAGEKKFTEADLPTEPEFDPNEDYDMWTVVEYTIEAIQADLVCTISAKKDFSEFYQECNFYGDDQMTVTTWDGEKYETIEDKTGFMGGDIPAILDKAIEQGIWIYFDDEYAAAAPAGEFTEADLPTEPEFDPNPDYDVYTVVEYTIEAIQADLVCTVSAKADFSEFYQECNFYGDDQMTVTTWDGEKYETIEDKTGFMGGDIPAILDKALEQGIWLPIK